MVATDDELWSKQWGGNMYASYGTVHSKGLLILVNRNSSLENVQLIINTDRVIAITFECQQKKLNVINVHAPNHDGEKPDFLSQLENHVLHIDPGDGYVIAGDFNMVLNNNLDIISGKHHDYKIVELFGTMLSSLDVYDAWRLLHGSAKEYTWCKSNPFIARRLDYILLSDSLVYRILACEIMPVPNTDHSGVSIDIQLQELRRGKSHWKFNENLLKSPTYTEIIKNLFDEIRNLPGNLTAQQKWDLCKLHIKETTINYAKKQAKNKRNDWKLLESKLKTLELVLSVDPDNVDALANMKDTKLALDLYALQQAQGAQVRSRINWIENGEKNTKYFLNLEKARASSNTIITLKDQNGKSHSDQSEILQLQHHYFSQLYSKKFDLSSVTDNLDDFCMDLEVPQLSEAEKESCEGPVTPDELFSAVKKLNNHSAPGSDGLTVPFYKYFWDQIKGMVLESLNEALLVGLMSTLQRQGIITLFHKGKQLPRDELSNWRPITLTNTDYKILAKVLAMRMQGVVRNIIHENQVGYVRGRSISTILRTIGDVIELIQYNNDTGAIIALDYAKAFDSVNKQFLCKVFQLFGFGHIFQQWVKTITDKTVSCVTHCGWKTAYFEVQSGIRQGCPFSPLAFILAVELLALKIRQSNGIAGIRLPNIMPNNSINIKILQYADDTTLFMRDRNDILNGLSIVTQYSKFSGLKLNKNKTEAMWLGREKDSRVTVADLKWKIDDPAIKILGVIFSNSKPASEIMENWEPRLQNVKRIIKSWEKRDLSLIGKIHVIKTFLLSQFIYLMQSISLPEVVLTQINTTLFKFVWKKRTNNKRAFEKVRRNVLCSSPEDGGLNMINILDMQDSFLIAWMNKLWCNRDSFWAHVPLFYISQLGPDLAVLNSNIGIKEFRGLTVVKAHFWKSALISWLKYQKIHECDEIQPNQVKNQNIWNNNIIRYQGKVLFFPEWINKGIINIGDLYVDDHIKTFAQMEQHLGTSPRLLLQYNVVVNAVPQAWKNVTDQMVLNVSPTFGGCNISVLTSAKVRKLLVKLKWKQPCSINFWANKYLDMQLDSKLWNLAFATVKESRLRVLQFKILHNIYPTRILLAKMGITENNRCPHCNEIEYIEHFFFSCQISRLLWSHIEAKLDSDYGIYIQFEEKSILFGVVEGYNSMMRKLINTHILIGKLCISKFKYGTYHNITNLFDYECTIRERIQGGWDIP